MSNTSTRSQDVEKGIALLAAFSPVQRALIVSACAVRGQSIESDVAALASASVLNVAPLEFIRAEALSSDDILNLLVGLKAIVKDALMADWTSAQYAQAIERAVKVPSDLAAAMAKNVVTEDTDAAAFARGIADWIPNIPLLPFDDVARGAVKLANSLWANLVPKDFKSRAMDAAYEWLLLGTAIRQLAKRRVLTDSEEQFELEANAVASASPTAIPAIMSLVGALQSAGKAAAHAAESGDIALVDDVVHPYGHLLQEGTALLRRAETGDVSEHEIGGFGSKVKNFLKKAAGPLGAIAGSAIGMPQLGGAVGSALGGIGGKKKSRSSADATMKKAASIARDMGVSGTSMTYAQIAHLLKEVARS